MAERTPRSHNIFQEWKLKGAAAIALGAIALTGCGAEHAGASHTPDRPAATASATPGSNESSPTPNETASTSPETTKSFEMGETVLAKSEVYSNLSELDQTSVEKNAQLSFQDFEKLPPEERAMVALVLSDAHSAEYIKGVGDLVLPGNNGQPLKDIYIPALDKHSNAAQDLYDWVLKSTPEDVTPSNNGQPYFQVQLERAIAAAMASTGDPKLLEDAKKIVAGSLYHGSEPVANADGAAADQDTWGHLTQRINDLRNMSDTKTDTLPDLGYPNAGTDRHHFANAVGGVFDGYPAGVTLGFQVYNAETQQMEDGVNSDGAGAAAYQVVVYKDKSGQPHSTWTESETTASADGSGIGLLEPNPTK
jgi:hypothetical protein